jgi:hypothetical protein
VALWATAWRGYYEPAGDWSGEAAGPDRVDAGPGWSFELALGSTAVDGPDITHHVSATFAVVANGRGYRCGPAMPPRSPLRSRPLGPESTSPTGKPLALPLARDVPFRA